MDCPVGVHCHNDAGLAVALSMEGVLSGAGMVQGTINGHGERCRNANLCTLLPNLCLKMGKEALAPGAMARMAPTARLTSEIANLSMDEHSPYVGNSAFAHKGGMHIDGMLKNRRSFEHISPSRWAISAGSWFPKWRAGRADQPAGGAGPGTFQGQ